MMEEQRAYLVPANTKKAALLLSFLRPVDAIIAGTGIGISLLLLILFSTNASTLLLLLLCLPGVICGLLVVPIPRYHNVMVAIQSIIRFYTERRNFIWRGWCIYDEFKDK